MIRNIRNLAILTIITMFILIILTGCLKDSNNNISNIENSNHSKIKIDGDTIDWQEIPVSIADVAGDVPTGNTPSGEYYFDTLNITLAKDKHNLYILFEFTEDISKTFNIYKDKGNIIGTISFDTNNDSIFESEIDIWTGVIDVEAGISSSGNGYLFGYTNDTIVDYYICYFTSKYDKNKDELVRDWDEIRSDEKPGLIAYNNNFLEIKVPLNAINSEYNKENCIKVVFDEYVFDSSENFLTIYNLNN